MIFACLMMSFIQTPEPDLELVHNELRNLRDVMTKALNQRDLDTLVAHVHPDVVFTTMNGDVCRGREAIRDYFRTMLEGPDHIVEQVTVAFEVDELTRLYGDDMGIAFGASADHYQLTDGMELDIAGRWTCTMVRSDGQWLIAAFHYSANLFDNPILQQTKRWILRAAVLAGVVGLILGLLIARLFRSKPTNT